MLLLPLLLPPITEDAILLSAARVIEIKNEIVVGIWTGLCVRWDNPDIDMASAKKENN